jgi:putative salt-induced outer membrane protein YdiY
MTHTRRILLPSVALILALNLPAVTAAQEETEEEKKAWSDSAEFSLVATDGNSDTTTLGFKNLYNWRRGKSSVEVKAGAIWAESTTTDRFAVGSAADFDEVEVETKETTAESYYLNGKYGREVSKRTFWYTGLGWDRNIPAGVQNRYVAEAGLGNLWRDDDHLKFRTEYALTYTDQEDVVDNPDTDDSFAGLRLSYNYKHQFGENTTYDSILVLDENLDDTDDWRADFTNSVSVAMNSRLALKVSLQWLYDNEPSFEEVDLFDPADLTTPIGTVLVQLDDLDTILTASLVVNF